MKCPSCGSDNFEGAAFCSLCLTSLAGDSLVPTPLSQDPVPEPSPETGSGVGAPIDTAIYASGMLAAERLKADPPSARKRRGIRIPALGDAVVSPVAIRFIVGGLVFIIALLGWGFSGGFGDMIQGKRAEVPIPAGAKLIATQESVTKGLLGPLDEERRAMYATRVFLVPLPMDQVIAYYGSGGQGDTKFAEREWTRSPESMEKDTYMLARWDRTTALGYRAEEEQNVLILVQEQRLGGFDEILYSFAPGTNPFSSITDVSGGAVPGTSCIVAVSCMGAGIEEVGFIEE